MTFKALSNIIKKHKEEEPIPLSPEERQRERGIAETQALINTLKTNHNKAYQERKTKWENEHPGMEFYQRTEEDNRRDCTLDEWYWDFFERIYGKTPEQRYQQERNPDHGFGHVPFPIGIHKRSWGECWPETKCVPRCRFYEPTGRLTELDILEDYRGYQQFEDAWQAYKELEQEKERNNEDQNI